MTETDAALLVSAGIGGGLINALAGGATLITFPAMLAVGLPTVAANASSAVAITPGHLLAAVADREKLPAFDKRLLEALAICILGGSAGALTLLAIPEQLFTLPIPALIAFATVLFALSPRIAKWAARDNEGERVSTGLARATLVMGSVYGGFFGAGLGVILTAVLAILDPTDIRSVKVLKNLLATAVSLSAVTIFIVQNAVAWGPAGLMFIGALIGGYTGGHLVRVLPASIVRHFVVFSGCAMTAIYAMKYWI
jgi:uncharacterized membrane protein YfcA